MNRSSSCGNSESSQSSTFDTLLDTEEGGKSTCTGEEKGKAAKQTEKTEKTGIAMKTEDLEEEPLDRRAQQLLILKKSRKKKFVLKNTTDKTNPPRRQTSPPIQTKPPRRMASVDDV